MKTKPQIPIFYYKLLKWFCKEELWGEIQGDLEESFQINLEQRGIAYAKKTYKNEVRNLIRPSVIKKLNLIQMNSSSGLFLNYIKIAFRTLLKDKTHAIISIFGLVLGITTAVLLIQFNKFEESYDNFHAKSDEIFRIRNDVKSISSGEITNERVVSFYAAHPTVSEEIPEIINSTHIYDDNGIISFNEISFNEEDILFTTRSFFEMFSFDVLQGNISDMDKKRSVFLSESMAEKLFSDENPVGKQIDYHGIRSGAIFKLTVAGIFKDIVENSHLKANVILPVHEFISYIDETQRFGPIPIESVKWRWNDYYTYIEIQPNAQQNVVDKKLNQLYHKYRKQWDDRLGRSQLISTQPLASIHLESDLFGEIDTPGNKDLVLFLYLVTTLILLIAWINYVNMATAKAMNRGREVGVRKVLGAYRKQLIAQFLMESILINLIAIIISIGFLFLLVPYFELFIQKNVFTQFYQQIDFWALFGLSILIGALISGVYPAFVLSAFQPSKVLRVSFKYTGYGIWLRKGLVLLQFMIAIFLLSGATAIQSQLDFMINHDSGIDIDQSLIINTPASALRDSTYETKIRTYVSSINQYSATENYAISSLIPGALNRWRGSCGLVNNPGQESAYSSR